MGNISISISGSFRPNEKLNFCAMEYGHAVTVQMVMQYLEQEALPAAIKQDKGLRDQGHAPERGWDMFDILLKDQESED